MDNSGCRAYRKRCLTAQCSFWLGDRLDHRSLYAQRLDAIERGDTAAAAALDREPDVPRGISAHVHQATGWVLAQLDQWKAVRHRNDLREFLRAQRNKPEALQRIEDAHRRARQQGELDDPRELIASLWQGNNPEPGIG